MMNIRSTAIIFGWLGSMAMGASAAQVDMALLSASGNQVIGHITLEDSDYGLVLTPALEQLTPGMHGFHIHAKGSCAAANKNGKSVLGGAAGGHFDPDNTNKHGLPWTHTNHKGDLPALYVDAKGKAEYAVLAPRLTLEEIKGKAIMIHAGGDNHSDHPAPLGGGGARMACGVIAE
jgi:Cu-Zn family superoxide dismutase